MATVAAQYQDPSTRADLVRDGTVLVPPQLPPFLATVFDLKSISGSPSAEEVKLVHAAIRTLNSLLHSENYARVRYIQTGFDVLEASS